MDQHHRQFGGRTGQHGAVWRLARQRVAYNTAHDVVLPDSSGAKIGFVLCPVGENAAGLFHSYLPDDFKYQITVKEIKT